ncbi:DUF58 domain-containing protein [Hylemonella gracilis]|uniref:DUF58 domain-containing protein n=1 Tax=Hylemonella gracilis ATCC 19624 TaxID=887062 RepID=F3KXH8_9BURK|nr:DUF58 domain-containing protein [Hylemonella gracilis]EGI75545.1 hypothetical protein HGR_15839 [Hylemonella gracilis ATCC 19624]
MPTQYAPERTLQRLEWTVLRRLDGLLQGDHRTLLRGAGLDLADLREYQDGDDVRHIDWNVTARVGHPHVRVHAEDRELSAWFLIDLSASLDFGSGQRPKRAQLIDVVAVLARLLTRRGNRVGAVIYDRGVRAILPPGTSRPHVLRLLHLLHSPPKKAAQTDAGPTRLHELMDAANHLLRRRSAVFLLSDFLSEPGWERPCAHLARRHDMVAVRLYDPLEQQLPDLGLLPLQDVETGEVLLVDTQDPVFRERFAHLAAQREDALRDSLARAGLDLLELAAEEDLLPALLRFVRLRAERTRAGANRPGAVPQADRGLRLVEKEVA